MATTTFTDQETVIEAAWLNDVDALVYDVFGGISSVADALSALTLPSSATDNQLMQYDSGTSAWTAVDVSTVVDLADPGEIGATTQYDGHFTGLTVGFTGHTESSITISAVSYEGNIVSHAEGATDLAGFLAHRHSDSAGLGAHQIFARSRGTDDAETVVQNNDILGRILAVGHDGTDYAFAAQIEFEVDGTPGAGDMPGRIVFSVSPDGTESLTDQLTIQNNLVTVNAATLSCTDLNVGDDLAVVGTFTSPGIDDNVPDNTVITFSSGDHYTAEIGASGVTFGNSTAALRVGTWGAVFGALGSGETNLSNNVYVASGTDTAIGTGDTCMLALNEGGSGGGFDFYGSTGESVGTAITWGSALMSIAADGDVTILNDLAVDADASGSGSVFGGATGGAQGAGTINAAGLYVDGNAVGVTVATGSFTTSSLGAGATEDNTVTHGLGTDDVYVIGSVLCNSGANSSDALVKVTRPDGSHSTIVGNVATDTSPASTPSSGDVVFRVKNTLGTSSTITVNYMIIRA